MYDAFISYSHDDGWWAGPVADTLRRRKTADGNGRLRVFLDADSIAVGLNWYKTLEAALEESRHVIPVYSKSYFQSRAAGWELLQKLLPDLNASDQSILPCLIEPCEIPKGLRHIQHLDFRKFRDTTSAPFGNLIAQLVDAIRGNKPRVRRDRGKPKAPSLPSADKFMPPLPYYLYISDTKLQMLSPPSSRVAPAGTVRSREDRFSKVATIVRNLSADDQIGPVESDKPFVSGELVMKWGMVDWGIGDQDVRIVFFVTDATDPMILLAGSVYHVIGTPSAKMNFQGGVFGFSGSHLPGIIWALRGPAKRVHNVSISDYFLMARLCHGELPFSDLGIAPAPAFAEQRLTFVARVLKHLSAPTVAELKARSHARRPRPKGTKRPPPFRDGQLADIVIASPLYVALAE